MKKLALVIAILGLFNSCVLLDDLAEALDMTGGTWFVRNTTGAAVLVEVVSFDSTDVVVNIHHGMHYDSVRVGEKYEIYFVSRKAKDGEVVWSDLFKGWVNGIQGVPERVDINIYSTDMVLLKTWSSDFPDVGKHNLFDESQWEMELRHPDDDNSFYWHFDILPEDIVQEL